MIPPKVLRIILENLVLDLHRSETEYDQYPYKAGITQRIQDLNDTLLWVRSEMDNSGSTAGDPMKEALTALWKRQEDVGQVFGCIRGALDPATDPATRDRLAASTEELITAIAIKHKELAPKIQELLKGD